MSHLATPEPLVDVVAMFLHVNGVSPKQGNHVVRHARVPHVSLFSAIEGELFVLNNYVNWTRGGDIIARVDQGIKHSVDNEPEPTLPPYKRCRGFLYHTTRKRAALTTQNRSKAYINKQSSSTYYSVTLNYTYSTRKLLFPASPCGCTESRLRRLVKQMETVRTKAADEVLGHTHPTRKTALRAQQLGMHPGEENSGHYSNKFIK